MHTTTSYRSNCTRAMAFILFILPAALLSGTAHAQYKPQILRYYQYCSRADNAKTAGKTDSAIYYFRQAFKADPDNGKRYYNLANLLIRQGNYSEGLEWTERSILSGNVPNEIRNLFDKYDSIRTRPEIVAFEKRFSGIVRTYYATSYNIPLSRLIYQMRERDQAIRNTSAADYRKDSITDNTLMPIMAHLDTAVNLNALLDYLKESGFPKLKEMDDDVSNSFALIIHHLLAGYDCPKRDTLERLVKQAIYDGRYSSYAYMLAMDWRQINTTGKQIYGTYIGQDKSGDFSFDPPIEDVGRVDMLRAQWLQKPLKDVPLSDWRKPKMPVGYRP